MGYVLNRRISAAGDAAGVTIIETRGLRHQIEFRVAHVDNQPKIIHTTAPSPIEAGTKITVHWPPELRLLEDAAKQFQQLVAAYAWFNPHLTLRGVWRGREVVNAKATNPDWESGARAIRPAPCGTTRRGSSAISPPMSRATATSSSAAPCARSSPNSADSPAPPFSARFSMRSGARPSRSPASSASSGSIAPASPISWRR